VTIFLTSSADNLMGWAVFPIIAKGHMNCHLVTVEIHAVQLEAKKAAEAEAEAKAADAKAAKEAHAGATAARTKQAEDANAALRTAVEEMQVRALFHPLPCKCSTGYLAQVDVLCCGGWHPRRGDCTLMAVWLGIVTSCHKMSLSRP
jgi:hypothetical protein